MSTKIGGIYVEIRADKTQFQKDLSAIRSEAKKSGSDIGKALDDGITGPKAQKGISDISTGLLQLSKSASVTDSSFKTTASSISKGLSDVASQVGMTSKEFASLNEKMLRNQAYQQAQTALKGIASAAGLSAKETKNMAQQMGYSATQATEMANKIHKVRDAGNATLTMFSKFATAAAVAFATHELINFAKQIKDVGVAFDSLNRSYEAIMGSQRLADAEMQFVNETAKKLGLNLVSLEDSYKGLLAASKGTTLEGANTRDLFIAVAKASSVLGMSADDTTGSLRAFIQMMSKGTVQSEELRGQLGERLYGAFNLAAKAMGTTTEDLNKMLQRGDVLATDLIPKLANVLEGDYSEAAEKAGESSRAAFENFNTAVLELKRTLGESGILEFLANVTRNATQMINTVSKAIGSISADKTFVKINEDLDEANEKLAGFEMFWGNSRESMPNNRKTEFDELITSVKNLEAEKEKLEKGLQNEQGWEKYRDGMVSTFSGAASKASKASTELEEKLRKEYAKTTDYRLAEAKKELASYVKIEGAKPEYVAMLKNEIASLEKKANATSISGHKSVTASHNKELEEQVRAFEQAKEEQKRALESFNDEYKKVFLSTFDYEIAKLDEKYEYFKAQKVDEVRLEEWYAEEHFRINQEDIARFMDQQEKAKEEQKRVIESFDDDYKRVFLSTFEYEISKLDEKYEYYKAQKIDELRLEEWYAEEKLRIQNEADEEAKEKQQDAYDELYDGIYGFTRNVIDDWDDMGNTLVDMAESMVKDIISAFITQKIAIPIYMYAADMAGISTGLASGMSPSSGGLASMTSPISSLFTIGKTAYTLVTEGVSAAVSDLVGADLLGSISSAMFGETAATAAGTAYTTISPTVASTIESAYAVANGGTATSTGAASGAGMGGAAAAGLAVAAFMAIDQFLGSHDQADPDLYVQSPTGGMTEATATYTVGNRDAVTDEIVTIFDAAFASLDESLDANIVDAVTASAFRGKARITDLDETDANALINSLVESAFSGNYTGSIGSFDGLFGAGSLTGYKSVKVDGEDTDYWNNILTPLTEAISGQYSKGLSDILMEAIGLDSGIFDFDFLKSLQAEGENLFDTFANFAIVVQETDGFVENITRQMDEFGFTVEEAFTNILVVISVLDEIQASVDALATTSSVAALVTLTESWYALIDSLEAAYATTTQITEAETAMAQVLGANITGLTADALQSALSEGSDIESILQTSIQNAAYADIAQKIAEEYISGINEQIGQIWIDTGGDLEAVAEAMQDIDTTEAQAAMEELQESFGLLADSASDAKSTAEARQSEIDSILESANDYLSKSGLSDFESQMIDLEKESESLTEQLTELNATNEELAVVTEWLAANEQALIDARQEEIDSLLESASDYLEKSGMSEFESEMYDLRKESESLTRQLTELNATESELAVVTEWLSLKEHELIDARQAEIDSLLSSANDYLSKSGLSEFESQMLDLNNEADSLTNQLIELNATNEELAVVTEWLSAKEQELIDARQEEIDAFNKSIQDIISKNTLSDLEYELENLTSWYDEQKASAEGLGVALDAVNEAYELQKKAAYESAITNARSSYIESLQAEQSTLEDALSVAKKNYINGLNDEITALNETASEAESAVDSFESLLETIKDLKYSSVTDSELNPDKRMAFVESDLAIAMAKIQSGDTAEIKSGMEDLPTLTADFLELSKQTSGSFGSYQNDFAYVMRILNEAEQIAGDQKSTAELSLDELTAQTESLEATLNAVNGIDENLRTIEELEAAYNAAKSNLDNSWYQDEIDRLTEINSSVLSLTEAQSNYFSLLTAAITAGFSEYQGELELATSAAGVSSTQYSSTGTAGAAGTQGTNIIEPDWWEGSAYQKEYGDKYSMVLGSHDWSDPYTDGMTMSDYWEGRSKTAKFADGGTVSGPDSGYFMPTTFHGIEHITPDSEMTEVKEVLGEVKDILISIRDTGGNVNKLTIQTNRLLDRVTQGGTEMRVKEIA